MVEVINFLLNDLQRRLQLFDLLRDLLSDLLSMVLEEGLALRHRVISLPVKVDVIPNLEQWHSGGSQFAQKGNPDQIHLRVTT